MQKFEYRTPRYLADLPVLFMLQDVGIPGRCIEIGREGMKVKLPQPVPCETCGTVCLDYLELSLELRVSVVHTGADYHGLRFLFETDKDRNVVDRLVALLSGSKGQHRPVLVR